MIDWDKLRTAREARSRHYSAPPQNRYLEPVVGPLHASRRIQALEGWLEYERTTQPRT